MHTWGLWQGGNKDFVPSTRPQISESSPHRPTGIPNRLHRQRGGKPHQPIGLWNHTNAPQCRGTTILLRYHWPFVQRENSHPIKTAARGYLNRENYRNRNEKRIDPKEVTESAAQIQLTKQWKKISHAWINYNFNLSKKNRNLNRQTIRFWDPST